MPRLDTLTFHEKLGSMLDKSHRLGKLVLVVGQALDLESTELEVAGRAARLCKADLATQLVV